MTEFIKYHISPEYLSDGIAVAGHIDKDELKKTEVGDYTFYENQYGDWLFETLGKTKATWKILDLSLIDDAMRDHCYIDETDVFKHIKNWQDQITALNSKIDTLIYEAGIENIDIENELEAV